MPFTRRGVSKKPAKNALILALVRPLYQIYDARLSDATAGIYFLSKRKANGSATAAMPFAIVAWTRNLHLSMGLRYQTRPSGDMNVERFLTSSSRTPRICWGLYPRRTASRNRNHCGAHRAAASVAPGRPTRRDGYPVQIESAVAG